MVTNFITLLVNFHLSLRSLVGISMFFEYWYLGTFLLNQLKLWVIRSNFWNSIRFFLLKIFKSRSWKHLKRVLAFLDLFLFYSILDFTFIKIFFRHFFSNSLFIRHHIYSCLHFNFLHLTMNTLRLYQNSLRNISPLILFYTRIFLFLLLRFTLNHSY